MRALKCSNAKAIKVSQLPLARAMAEDSAAGHTLLTYQHRRNLKKLLSAGPPLRCMPMLPRLCPMPRRPPTPG